MHLYIITLLAFLGLAVAAPAAEPQKTKPIFGKCTKAQLGQTCAIVQADGTEIPGKCFESPPVLGLGPYVCGARVPVADPSPSPSPSPTPPTPPRAILESRKVLLGNCTREEKGKECTIVQDDGVKVQGKCFELPSFDQLSGPTYICGAKVPDASPSPSSTLHQRKNYFGKCTPQQVGQKCTIVEEDGVELEGECFDRSDHLQDSYDCELYIPS